MDPCVYNSVIDRLYQATSEKTNNRKVQTLRFDTNQLALMRDQTVH